MPTERLVLLLPTLVAQFNLRDAHLDGKDRLALDATSLTVTLGMYCDEGFQAKGGVNLTGARVGGNLSFRQAFLDGEDDLALFAGNLTVAGDLQCNRGFRAAGGIRLENAKVGKLNDDEIDGLNVCFWTD